MFWFEVAQVLLDLFIAMQTFLPTCLVFIYHFEAALTSITVH